jgi:hypothetical protein
MSYSTLSRRLTRLIRSYFTVAVVIALLMIGAVIEPLQSTASPSGKALLSGSTSSLSFGNIAVGSKSTLPFVITNKGRKSVTISQASTTGSGFSVGGLTLPLTLAAGQSTSFSISFAPSTTGSATGSVSVVSNATNSPTTASLSATGVNHYVTLAWVASTSPSISGYNVFRAAVSGGPYTQINSSLVGGTTYTDSSVSAGATYSYVIAAVNSSATQSGYSNQVTVLIP